MRILFVVPPLVGHINPTISVALSLQSLGHEVAWVGHPGRVRELLPEGAKLLPLDDQMSQEAWAKLTEKSRSVRGLESFQVLWEDVLVPLARSMFPGVKAALESFAPDVVVSDQQAIAGALAARKLGLPWATSCTTSAGITDPLAGLPKVRDWVLTQLAGLEDDVGVPHAVPADLSPNLVIVFSTKAFVGPELEFPSHYLFVGPSIQNRPDPTPFPWELLLPAKQRVFLSLGTVSREAGSAFYAMAQEALGEIDAQVIVSAPLDLLPSPPANFIVRERVPQLALLPHVNAVITHGGHNTVCESLANGLPLVVAPIRDDQPVIAGQIVAAGAGIRIKFGRTSAAGLRAATLRALDDASLRAGASAIQESFRKAGGALAAAEAILQLAKTRSPNRAALPSPLS